eukprot:10819344-Karenia_brevis.AAC.1
MQAALDGLGAHMQAAIGASTSQLNSLLSDSFSEGLASVQRSVAQRITAAEAEVGRAHNRINDHDQRLAALEHLPAV